MMSNVNPKTGVRYGVISVASLQPELAEELMYGPDAIDETYGAALNDAEMEANAEVAQLYEDAEIAASEVDPNMSDRAREAFIEQYLTIHYTEMGYEDSDDLVAQRLEAFSDQFRCDEPHITGTYEEIEYQITWLGGAPLLWILDGPVGFVEKLCSPCVPNAADLDSETCLEAEASETMSENGYFCYVVPRDWRATTPLRNLLQVHHHRSPQ